MVGTEMLAAAAVSQVARKIGEIIGAAQGEVTLCCSFSDDLESIKDTLVYLEDLLKNAERNSFGSERANLRHWLTQIKSLAFDIEDMVDDYYSSKEQFEGSSSYAQKPNETGDTPLIPGHRFSLSSSHSSSFASSSRTPLAYVSSSDVSKNNNSVLNGEITGTQSNEKCQEPQDLIKDALITEENICSLDTPVHLHEVATIEGDDDGHVIKYNGVYQHNVRCDGPNQGGCRTAVQLIECSLSKVLMILICHDRPSQLGWVSIHGCQ
uniref:Predicted protein n=1 Tax=Hordeum vulgare subsp. vulgare TaxID=112509 RepID=F2EB14_HORVV|nr:predicted protein [Hordeum vulgare subsp. vulgare]